MTQANILNDLSTLSKIPNKIINEIVKKECLCIGSAIHDAMMQNEDAVIINIGVGTLSVELSTKQCKFVPSKDLKTAIKRSLDDKVDPVELEINSEIVEKLLNICDEVL